MSGTGEPLPSARPGPSAFAPAALGPLQLRNRVIKAATFEGVMPRGAVSQDLIDFHVAVETVACCQGCRGSVHPVGSLRGHEQMGKT